MVKDQINESAKPSVDSKVQSNRAVGHIVTLILPAWQG